MKLSIVIPCMNQLPLVRAVYNQLRTVTSQVEQEVEFVIIDNGSNPRIDESDVPGAKIVRFDKSVGVYPTFRIGFENTTGDVVAFFHSDLVVWEWNWNGRVIEEFGRRERLGMIGFIGSNQIDMAGGRGLGTTSSFMGKTLNLTSTHRDAKWEDISKGDTDKAQVVETVIQSWTGSPASAHGKVDSGFSNAAVVDGCAMIIRREAWNEIGYREDFPLHHFYDRLISTQLLEKKWQIGVLGIGIDHISGQTVNAEDGYKTIAREWMLSHGVKEGDVYLVNPDDGIYRIAEKMWLEEYRDRKHLVPITVNP